MSEQINRREFVKATTLGVVGAAAGQALAAAPVAADRAKSERIRKGVVQSMMPSKMPWPDRLMMLRDAGFDGFEAYTTSDPKDVETIRAAADRAGLMIHSVMNQAHWQYPLSSADPKVVATSMEGMRTSLHNAKAFGAETVLLVPAVVNPETRYADAYTRSQKQIRELLPLAQELGIIIAIEEVWNKFLLSPIEFARYVDEFRSPFVGAYFDVGNIVAYGYPQDWIRTLGKRIKMSTSRISTSRPTSSCRSTKARSTGPRSARPSPRSAIPAGSAPNCPAVTPSISPKSPGVWIASSPVNEGRRPKLSAENGAGPTCADRNAPDQENSPRFRRVGNRGLRFPWYRPGMIAPGVVNRPVSGPDGHRPRADLCPDRRHSGRSGIRRSDLRSGRRSCPPSPPNGGRTRLPGPPR